MAHRVLVVDDHPQIRQILVQYLNSSGYQTFEAGDAASCMAGLDRDRPDVVLLDLGLPDADGLEVLRRIRATSDVYVLAVTARSEEVDRLVGLSVGADDYITKPFSPREVVARVGAVLRRSRSPLEPAPRSFGELQIDTDQRAVRLAGRQVRLSALEFDLLAALSEAPGRVFSRRQLLEKVWNYDFFGDERVVDVHIRNLRRALSDDASAPRYIDTVRGVGYRFVQDRS